MTPEERFERIERHVEFMAQNQAQLTTSTSTLTQDVGALKQDLVELARIVQQHVVTTEARFQMVAGQLGTVSEHFGTVAEQFRKVDERLESLAEAQRTTEERLNTLIIIVERYFSDGKR